MLEFLSQYYGTILVGLGIAGVIALIVVHMVKQKKQGKSPCSCGCSCKGCHGCGK